MDRSRDARRHLDARADRAGRRPGRRCHGRRARAHDHPADLAALAPDVIVVKPCGFTLSRALEERDLIERNVVTACAGARVYVTDGNAYFNRPGPRLVESLEIMAACVYPEPFDDFHRAHAHEITRLA